MERISYLHRSLWLLLYLTVSCIAWAQAPQKPTPAIQRGTILLRAGERTAEPKQASTAPKDAPKAASKREKERKPRVKSQSATPTDRYIALKSNIPFLAVAIQNLALEVQCHPRISVELPIIWSISDLERSHAVRTFALQPEARWWTKAVGQGHFFGVHAHVAWFNLKWEEDRYQSGKCPLLGAGLSYGYQLPLSTHWAAEFNIGAGYAHLKYNTYYNIENGAQIDTRVRNYWGITRLGLSLAYRF